MLDKLKTSFHQRRDKLQRLADDRSASTASDPTMEPSRRYYDLHTPIDPCSIAEPRMPPLQLTQEELDWIMAAELDEQEKKERADREAEDERIVRDMVERERLHRQRVEEEAERQAREVEETLYDLDLRHSNGVLECAVCYGEFYRGEVMIQCPECHLLCQECAVAGAEAAFEQLDGSLPCLAVGDCGSFYPPEEARRFLDDRQWAQLEKVRLDADVATLRAEGLKKCPFCFYAVLIDADDTSTTLDCLNPDCAKRTCLTCLKIDHGDIPCGAANPNSFNRLAEAMSEALLRRCPQCQKPFVKEKGCNLITCADKTCQTKSCYLCNAVVKDYGHWDLAGPCKGRLYKDDSVLAGVKLVRDAGIEALESEVEREAARGLQVG